MRIPNYLVYAVLAVLAVSFWGGVIWLTWQFVPSERVIDCSRAEFHPDYTPQMKQQCRKVRT